MANKTKGLLKSRYSLDISHRQLSIFIKEYNNYRMSLSECVKYIHDNPDEFYNFILEHTEIPLFKKCQKQQQKLEKVF